jgi:hypothetical protein
VEGQGQTNGPETCETNEPTIPNENGNEGNDIVEKSIEPKTTDPDKVLEEGEIE